MEGLLNNEF